MCGVSMINGCVAAFNTAQWNTSVSGYRWPGPKWMKENVTILNNFTCYFKVRRFYSFTLPVLFN